MPPELRSRCVAALKVLERESALQHMWSMRLNNLEREREASTCMAAESVSAAITELQIRAERDSLGETLRRRQESIRGPLRKIKDTSDKSEENSSFFITSDDKRTRSPDRHRGYLRVNPLGLHGRGALWDAEEFRATASIHGGVLEGDVGDNTIEKHLDSRCESYASNQKSNDASIDMPDDYEHHLAAVLIQRIARGRIGSNEAHRVAASRRALSLRGSLHDESLSTGEDTAATFFRSLLSASNEVMKM